MPSTKGKRFFSKFFWEGQKREEDVEAPDNFQEFLDKYRKYVAVLVPFTIVQLLWWLTAFRYNWLPLFPNLWPVCLVMVAGATMGGMTSVGGGAVAFPVMTILLNVLPEVVRDFTLTIQSIGLSCATFSIFYMNIQIEKAAIIFGGLGSIPGFVVGSLYIDQYLIPEAKKMLFVSIWGSFAIALFLLNHTDKRRIRPRADIGSIGIPALLLSGFIGGIFTSIAGSGVDIAIFSVLTLFFRVSEKIATPTSVVLMALDSLIGVYYRAVWVADIVPDAWDYVKVCIPVVVLFAPLGSFLGSHFHRKTLAFLIYVLQTLAILGFLMTKPHYVLLLIGACILLLSLVFFRWLTIIGKERFINMENKEMATPLPSPTSV